MAPGGADPCHDGAPGLLFHCPVVAPGFLGVTRTDSATCTGGGGRADQVWGTPTGKYNGHQLFLGPRGSTVGYSVLRTVIGTARDMVHDTEVRYGTSVR